MNRIAFHIDESEDGLSIKQFLRGKLSFSMRQISRIKYRPDGFLVNGTPQWVNFVLHTGDKLEFSLDDAENETAPGGELRGTAESASTPPCPENAPAILYEDPYILIADKPAGMVSHPSHGHRGDSALTLLEAGRGRLYLIGRLDKDTSGVLLFAKQRETASVLARKRSDRIQKVYLAAVHGIPEPPSGEIRDPIGIGQEFPLKMRIDPESGKEAVTRYETLFSGSLNEDTQEPVFPHTQKPVFSLLRIQLEHGRTHQIRVHLASAGHPLLGDRLYGADDRCTCARLHAAQILLIHPYTGKQLIVRPELPGWASPAAPALFSNSYFL